MLPVSAEGFASTEPYLTAASQEEQGVEGCGPVQCTIRTISPSPSPRLGYNPIRIHPGLVCLVSGTRH